MKKLFFFAACLTIWGAAHIVFAQTPTTIFVTGTIGGTNNLTVGLPGTHDVSKEGPVGLIGNLYDFALMAGGILAFGSILYGAVVYLAQPGNHEAQSGAKARIRDAFLGLLLLAGIYMILHIVNPGLTKLQFPTLKRLEAPASTLGLTPEQTPHIGYMCTDENGKEVSTTCYFNDACDDKCTGTQKCVRAPKCDAAAGNQGQTGVYGYKGMTPPPGTLSDAAARSQLSSGAGITVNKADCTLPPGATRCTVNELSCTNCTSLDGIPQAAIDNLVEIAKGCNCSFKVTGGTEAGHKEHGVGKAIVDVEASNSKLNQYIFGIAPGTEQETPFLTVTGNDGIRYMYEDVPPHWHLRF
jgi:hypothetical protein